MRTLRCIITLILVASGTFFSSLNSPYDYLNYGIGARPAAMGKAYLGLSNDPTAVYWNPSGLARVYNNQLSVTYGNFFGGGNLVFAGFTQPVVYLGTFSAGGIYYTGTGETNTGAFLSFAADLYSYSLGVTLKGINQQFTGYSAFGFGADVGLSIYSLDSITFSLVAANLVKPSFALDVNRVYPLVLKGGACVSLYDRRVNFTVDIEHREDSGFAFHGGLEYKPYRYLSIRGGVDHTVPTAGFGLSSGNFYLDYALTSLNANSNEYCHQVTACVKFGSFDMEVTATPVVFSPLGSLKTTRVEFKKTTRYGTKSWQILIIGKKHNIVKTLTGRENPPEYFIWDAKTEQGDLVPDGEYEIELTLIDKVNETERAAATVTVDTRRPETSTEMEIQ